MGWTVVVVGVTAFGVADALPGRNTVDSGDIINGQVRSVDIGRGQVKTSDLAAGAVGGGKLKLGAVDGSKVLDGSLSGLDVEDGSLTGDDIADGSVGRPDLVPGAVNGWIVADSALTGSDIADGSLFGSDIADGSITGRDVRESSLSLSCQTGTVGRSFTQVRPTPEMPTSWTTSSTYKGPGRNCAGGSIQVRRIRTGYYGVRFVGDPSQVAIATPDWTDNYNDSNNFVSVNWTDYLTTPYFLVYVRNQNGDPEDGWFNIATL